MSLENASNASPPPPKVISGKLLTTAMLVILLATGGLFYAFTTAYANYNAARRQTERCWRELADELNQRYQRLDLEIARSVDAGQVEINMREQWRSTRDRFSGTSLSSHQIAAAQALEALVGQLQLKIQLNEQEANTYKKLAEEYSLASSKQTRVGQSLGSRMLKLLLNLPDPPEFVLQP